MTVRAKAAEFLGGTLRRANKKREIGRRRRESRVSAGGSGKGLGG